MPDAAPSADARVVVITGAANGLGAALAGAFAKRGYALALIDTDAAGLERVRNTLLGTHCSTHVVDIADEHAVAAAHTTIIAEHGCADLVINNAAVSMSVPFEASSTDDMKRLFAVNYWGTVHLCRQFLPDLRRRKKAHLVNIISGFAVLGFPGKTAYGPSKAAVLGFSQALRTELAGPSVHVSVVIPPPMVTRILGSGPHASEEKRAAEQRFIARNAMDVDKVAERIARRVLKGDPRIVIGASMFWADLAARLFPSTVHRMIGKRKDRFDFL